MTRRSFLLSAAAAPRARVTRLTFAPIQGRFHKFVAMNSYDTAPKGHTYENTLVRMATDAGVEGVGVMGYARPDAAFLEAVQALIGSDPRELAEHPAVRRYRHLEGPLFDLMGKLAGKPVWQLLGESVRDRVEVYDGTLYFSDVWFKDRGVRAVVEEAEEAQRSGYTAVKLKLGRGSRWMPRRAGLERDIEVVRAVRKAVGPRMKIMADANDGYRGDFEGAWRLVEATARENLHWMEEIFPENVEHYEALRHRMERAGVGTLIAEGESMTEPRQFEPYLKPRRLIDVMQMDIRTGGFLDNRALARAGEAAGAQSVPHNWGSQVGLLMGLHFAKVVKNAPGAEDDRSTCDAIIAEGYRFERGFYSVPDSPGLSIRVNEQVYGEKYRAKEIVVV